MAYERHGFIDGLDKMSKVIQEDKLIVQECMEESFVMSRVRKKEWNGCAPIEVPLQTGFAGDVSMTRCLPTDVYKGAYDKMVISGQGEIHGSLCVSEEDLKCYGSINRESYIDLVGDNLSRLSKRMVRYVDRGLLLNGSVTEITSNPGKIGTDLENTLPAGDSVVPGSLFIRCPKSLSKGEKFELVSDTITAPLVVYVTSVNAQDSYVVLQTNPVDGTAAVPAVVAPYILADNPKLLPCGYTQQRACNMNFCSIDENLGFDGSANHYGVPRDSSPILRGDFYDISDATAATVTKKLMDIFYRRAEDCAQDSMEVLVPYSLFAVLSKELENSKERTNSDKKAIIGYTSIVFCLPNGAAPVRITAVPKMPMDCAYIVNWADFTFYGDTAAKDPHTPNGSSQPSWYRERGCSYLYWKDIYLRGKLVNSSPCNSSKILLGTDYLTCI